MHPASSYIKSIIDTTPGYSVEILCADLGLAQDELLTPTEVSKELKISIRTINRMQASGRIVAHYVGGQRRFKRSEINKTIKDEK